MRRVMGLAIAGFCLAACASQIDGQVSATKQIRINDDHSDVGLELKIPRSAGRPAYMLSCHSWDYPSPDVDYSGVLQCWLRERGSKDHINLLAENTGRAWDDRSRFLAHHLVGACAADRDWGARRTYQANGMTITVSIDDVTLNGADIDSYRVTAKVDWAGGGTQPREKLTARPSWFDAGPCPL